MLTKTRMESECYDKALAIMDCNLATAIVSASGSVLVAIDRLETRLENIEQMLASYCRDVTRIKSRSI